jgi:predicted Rdx family selenoprotein
MSTFGERINAMVVVLDGNTETSACYYEVLVAGYVVWSRGGSYPETEKLAQAEAVKVRTKIRRLLGA